MRRVDIEKLLPAVYQLALQQTVQASTQGEGGGEPPLLGVMLDVMELLHADIESCLRRIEETFDPRRCPDRFVPLLQGWVSLRTEVSTGLGRKRELVANAVALAQRRGTRDQLRDYLCMATGLSAIQIHEGATADGTPRPFHVTVRVPGEAGPHLSMLHEIIAAEKPAHLTYELCVEPGSHS